nr:zf-CCHC domain-containing protein/DUF4219 domain-containing protein/UBN2 domain-containing protein [Tanacetum cinerariifolium]
LVKTEYACTLMTGYVMMAGNVLLNGKTKRLHYGVVEIADLCQPRGVCIKQLSYLKELFSEDEEYAMAVKDFKKFFRRRGKYVRQPHDEKRTSGRSRKTKKKKKIVGASSAEIQITS